MRLQTFEWKLYKGWFPYKTKDRHLAQGWLIEELPAGQQILIISGPLYYPSWPVNYLLFAANSRCFKVRTKSLAILSRYLKSYKIDICYTNEKGKLFLSNERFYKTLLFVRSLPI